MVVRRMMNHSGVIKVYLVGSKRYAYRLKFKRAKHIKVRFFWLKDLIDGDEIILVYVPSEELVADMLTKATTGAKFKYLRGKLLGTMEGDT